MSEQKTKIVTFDVVLIEGEEEIRYGVVPTVEMCGGSPAHSSNMSWQDARILAATLSDLPVLQSSWADIPI